MERLFEIIVENAVLQAKTTILEEAAGTQAGERYVYIVEAAGETLQKAKDFVVNNKGKLAALAGAAALAGGAYYAQQHPEALKELKDGAGKLVENVKDGVGKLVGKGEEAPEAPEAPEAK